MTLFRTYSLSLFNKVNKYFDNKRMHTSVSSENGQYVISLFDLSDSEADLLISKMRAYLGLVPMREQAA